MPGYVYVASSAPERASSTGNQNAASASGPGTGSTAAVVTNTNGVTSTPAGPDVNGWSAGKLPSSARAVKVDAELFCGLADRGRKQIVVAGVVTAARE